MITRIAAEEVKLLARQFKAIAIVGPRQSGKTTLARTVFPDKEYVSLENLDNRLFATEDTRGFLAQYANGAIFDEAQRVPELFSYLQQVLDEDPQKGKFILTGSNNFLLQENISQSLAGRIGYLYLLPFSTEEIATITNEQQSIEDAIYIGGYPPIYDNHISPNRWLSNYIRTYVERDVRQIKNVNNLGAFEKFVKLCAGRIGQLLNVTSLANETGVDAKTITSWISVLGSSFIVYLLKPHHQNFNKRLVKMPKLYFYDTGLACSLLGIQNAEQLKTHSAMGNLFENHVITDMIKARYNRNEHMNLYFWRDNVGNEMDLIIDNAGTLHPVEIKSGKTITPEFFKNFKFWQKISGTEGGFVIYGGEQIQNRSNGLKIVPWNSLEARI